MKEHSLIAVEGVSEAGKVKVTSVPGRRNGAEDR
jgi:hypothetical protein